MKIDGLTDAELDEALKVARDLSRYRSGARALLARAFIAVHAELARSQSTVAHLKRREADIIEACENVADGGQYRADIVSAIERIRRERDEARAELARRPALPPGAVDLNAHPMAAALREAVKDAATIHVGDDGLEGIVSEIVDEGYAIGLECKDADHLKRIAALALLGLARNGGAK